MQEVSLTEEAKSVLIGTLLGDGYLGVDKRGPGNNPFLQVERSAKDAAYLIWQHKVLSVGGLVSAPIRYRRYSDFRYNKTYYGCYFYSRCHPRLWEYMNILYPVDERTKVVTRKILERVTPLALAVWYMDDGSITEDKSRLSPQYAIRLSTYSPSDEIELIQDWFSSKWGISTKLDYGIRSDRYSIAIYQWGEISKFIAVVKPYILPCMERKLPRGKVLAGKEVNGDKDSIQ